MHLLQKHGTSEEVERALAAFAAVARESKNVSFPFWADTIEAERALAAGDHEAARAALARVAAHPRDTRDVSVEHWLTARLAEAEGDLRRAADAYAGVRPTYSWYVQSHGQLSLEVRVRRACLLQDLDDPGFDRAVLEELVEAWGDTRLPVVEEARRRLER